MRQLSVTNEAAHQLLGRLEHCKVIQPREAGMVGRVITAPGDLPGVIADFEQRG